MKIEKIEILKMVQISKLGCLVYSFDRKISFFREKKSKFSLLGWPGGGPVFGRGLSEFRGRGPKKVEKSGQNVENIEKINDFMVPEVPSGTRP